MLEGLTGQGGESSWAGSSAATTEEYSGGAEETTVDIVVRQALPKTESRARRRQG